MNATIEQVEFQGLAALAMDVSGARVVVSLLGGQVLSWTPRGGKEWLYLSEQAVFDGSAPIRGGVPVCFPQFADQGELPKHGFVRTKVWTVAEQRTGEGFAIAVLRIVDDEETRAIWPHAFALELTVAVEDNRLDLELSVENTGDEAFSFTGALHTYLRVSEVEEIALEGLYGFSYRDTAAGNVVRRESGERIMVDGEVDRIYCKVTRPLLVRDHRRSLGVNTEGFPDVVIWNPWETRCAALADMPDSGFRRMLCTEAAVADQAVELPPHQQWWGRQTLVAL
ncbi:D-hexose-6-phosphate mutarotase [Parazoarcus communis]|uniref:Putative glucose-6-phosphate 1-epimerase n=1 Tax=Parazoarcus communis TaxID=41977 RepID=A0A2U8H4K5_9RHOO|nr:D-hexose-6-phosphate mutarotase [Parazoarcus communis]AWI80917.1 D-hexose-6-phosphate mutarotase [Parazoarcus communis]